MNDLQEFFKRFKDSHAHCSHPDDRVPGDNIDDDDYDDDYHYHYHDSTDSKMWQGSLPRKKVDNVFHYKTKNIFRMQSVFSCSKVVFYNIESK